MSWSKRIFLVASFLFWPTALFLNNTFVDFWAAFSVSLIFTLSFFVYLKSSKLSFGLLLLIGIMEPKLILLPLVTSAIIGKNKKEKLIFLALALFVFLLGVKEFRGQSVLRYDHNAFQEVLTKQKLYPTIISARVFQNKGRVIVDKIASNTFILTDPNNYLFGNHPRQVRETQNLQKFPFFALVPLLYIFLLLKEKKIKTTLFFIAATILALVPLVNFDRHDILLWFPIFYLIYFSTSRFPRKPLWNIFFGVAALFSLWEIFRLFI